MKPIERNRNNRSLRRKQRKQRYATQGPEAHIRPTLDPRPTVAYRSRIDAVVLAGTDANPSRLIAGRNKALLDMGGRTLVRGVVEELLQTVNIDRVFVVGPVAPLQKELGDLSSRVRVVEQAGKMLRNAWAGVRASQRLQAAGAAEGDRPILMLSSDLPLISAAAVDDFVARCAVEDQRDQGPRALLVGVVEEASVVPYYPQRFLPGIIRPFVELRSGRFRMANIYVVRPAHLAHHELLETGFSYRKAKDWRNVLALAWSFFGRPGGWKAAWMILRFEATMLLAKRKGRLYRALRHRSTREELEAVASALLGGSLRLVETPFGGLSLDVDDEEDYLVLGQRFAEWVSRSAEKSSAKPA